VTQIVLSKKSKLKIALLPIDDLKPHEKGSPVYLELLKKEILKDGVLKYPIIADEKTHVILDGMHRWLALKSLGCRLIPVILTDAFQNPRIRVGRRRVHRYLCEFEGEIPIEEVISAGLSGRLMKPRSTRHFFPFSKFQRIDCPLDKLEIGEPQDVSKFLAEMSLEECKTAIKDWVEEITEELEFLNKRRDEVKRELKEFLERIKKLNNNFLVF
jgi:hypothetical protein